MKMETPKMDVVRFQEADVIVASSGPVDNDTVTLMNLGDKNYANNRVSGTAGTGFNLSFTDISNGSLAHLLNLDSEFKNGSNIDSLRNLVDKTKGTKVDENTYVDVDLSGYNVFNGTYVWSEAEGKYLHQ